MPKIFISYRREDSQAAAGRIYDRLLSRFGKDSVYIDVDTIPAGVDFRKHLGNAIDRCHALLVVIGERWLSASKEGQRRLDDPRDFVRVEIEAALERGVPVIPLLLGNTPMPREDELPAGLKELAYRNALTIDLGRDFHPHADRLIRQLEDLEKEALVAQAAERAAAKAKQAAPAPAPSDAVPRAAIDKSKFRRALPLILVCTGFLVLLIAGLLLLINSIGTQPEARKTDPGGLTQSVPTNPPSAGPMQPSDAGKDDWHLSDFRDDRDGRSLEAGGSGANIQRLAFSPDGKLLAVGGRGGVQLY